MFSSFSPFMMMNTSGTCATTKLIQCRDFGCYEVDISRKFLGNPDAMQDLSREDFLGRKKVVDQVSKWVKAHGKRGSVEWVPIAYLYEVGLASLFLCVQAQIRPNR